MHFSSFWVIAIEHSLAFLLVVVSPFVSYFFERPYLRGISSSAQKVRFYRWVLLLQWPLAVMAWCLAGASKLYFPPAQAAGLPWQVRILLGALLAAFFVVALMPFLQSLRGERYRAAYARAYRKSLDDMSRLLPETREERWWFAGISISAGVCEEVLCRGFMFRYLDGIALHLGLGSTVLLGAAIFGINHIYQGNAGVIKTGLAGLAFGGLFVVTGSLLLPMLVHAAVDLQAVFVMRGGNDGSA